MDAFLLSIVGLLALAGMMVLISRSAKSLMLVGLALAAVLVLAAIGIWRWL